MFNKHYDCDYIIELTYIVLNKSGDQNIVIFNTNTKEITYLRWIYTDQLTDITDFSFTCSTGNYYLHTTITYNRPVKESYQRFNVASLPTVITMPEYVDKAAGDTLVFSKLMNETCIIKLKF